MEHRVNKAIIGTLEGHAREIINKNKIKPTNEIEEALLKQSYSKGGIRKSRNRKNNKKYTKNKTYERPEKYVSKEYNKKSKENIQIIIYKLFYK